MKKPRTVAVHRAGGAFAERWQDYAKRMGHNVKPVNGYAASAVTDLRDCDVFLWHLSHQNRADLEYARQLLYGLETGGLKVFPNHATCWHFDDKIAQAKLFERLGVPTARTWVFFSKEEAASFLATARYPLISKLRRGAGSINVRLIPDRAAGMRVVHRMFGRGVSSSPLREVAGNTWMRARTKRPNAPPLRARVRRTLRRALNGLFNRSRERGYALFQEFIAGNDHDLRVTVIGERAFVFRRDVRPDDFRASGSGRLQYFDETDIPRDAIEAALEVSRRLGVQSMAYDFVRDSASGRPLLLEMCYVFNAQAVHDCPGHLVGGSTWRSGHCWPQDLILDDLLAYHCD